MIPSSFLVLLIKAKINKQHVTIVLYKMFCQIPSTCFGSIIVLDISEYPMNFTAYDLSIYNITELYLTWAGYSEITLQSIQREIEDIYHYLTGLNPTGYVHLEGLAEISLTNLTP